MGCIYQFLFLVTKIAGHNVDHNPKNIGSLLIRSIRRAAKRKTQCSDYSDGYFSFEMCAYFHFNYAIAQAFNMR